MEKGWQAAPVRAERLFSTATRANLFGLQSGEQRTFAWELLGGQLGPSLDKLSFTVKFHPRQKAKPLPAATENHFLNPLRLFFFFLSALSHRLVSNVFPNSQLKEAIWRKTDDSISIK